MSWHDPNSPWARALNRRVRILGVACAGPCVAVFGLGLLLVSTFQSNTPGVGGSSGDGIAILALFGIVVCASSLPFLACRIRRDQDILRKVPKYDGSVCPRCRTTLAQVPTRGCCPKCSVPYALDALQTYWADYALAPAQLRSWGAERAWRQRLRKLRRRVLENIGGQIVLQVLILVAVTVGVSALSGLSPTGLVMRFAPLSIGFCLIGIGGMYEGRYRKRSGRIRHCAACDYPQSPEGENPERCPECGAAWSRPGGLVTGDQACDPRYIRLACALGGVGVLLIILFFSSLIPGGDWTLRALPTSALIRDATLDGQAPRAEWIEIGRRRLTPAEKSQLAQRLLDKRLRVYYLMGLDAVWLWTQVSTGTLPNDVTNRYYREMVELRIDAPTTIRKGELLQVGLRSDCHYCFLPVGIEVAVYFGGFFVEADPTPFGRLDEVAGAHLLVDSKRRIHAEFNLDEAGPLRVRAVLYLAVGPGLASSGPPAQWKEDETATLPAAVLWSERIELEKVVQVVE